MAISVNLSGISEAGMGLQKSQSSEVFYLANLCAEDALIKLKKDLGYAGGETLTFDQGSCIILPIEGIGNLDRVVKTEGNIYNQIRRIEIRINKVNPRMEIGSWREVVDF